MTLRVAHVLNSPGHGGVPRVAHALVRHLDPKRFASHVFYLKPGVGADLFDDLDIPRRVAKSASKATAMTELVAWLDAHRIDILHTHSFRPNLYARMAGAVLKPDLRVVAHYHNEYADKWHSDTLVLERRLARLTDLGLAVSSAVACHVSSKTGLRLQVLENGVDLIRVTGGCRSAGRNWLDVSQEAQVVGLVGRICRQKGVDTFVDAAIRLCPSLPEAHFVVVGDSEDQKLTTGLLKKIEAESHANRITFVAHNEKIADIYAALDLLAIPSRWEGFGLVAAEAMAAGVPVVASDVGGLPGVLGDAGWMVPPDDAPALSSAIARILSDPSSRARMVSDGRRQAARFDWNASAAKLASLYEGLQS